MPAQLPTQLTGLDHEIWENASKATLMLKKIDTLGKVTTEPVLPGRSTHLTPQERKYNQELAAGPTLDFFNNGYLRPVKLLDSEEETPVLQANVNAMSEAAMKEAFSLGIRAFTSKMNEVTNAIVVDRMLELASDCDASVRQVEVLQARLGVLRPGSVNEVEAASGSTIPGAPAREGSLRAVTPR